MYTREHCLYKKLHNTWNTKTSLINRVRLSFKILKHKYWIIKKKIDNSTYKKKKEKHETNKVVQKHILV